MAVQNLTLKVSDKQEIAHDTYLVRIANVNDEPLDFQPGQFATILVAPNTRRSYSIASVPGETYIDLIADTVAGGPGSQFFEKIQVEDEVQFLFPLGNFTYLSNSKPAYFFATGTGLVPFLSMIKFALEQEQSNREIHLFVGFRHEEGVFYESVLEELASKYDNFKYTLTVSQPSDNWQGNKGRITEYYQDMIEENADIDCYICGSRNMIEDVQAKLLAKNIAKEQIHFEQFY